MYFFLSLTIYAIANGSIKCLIIAVELILALENLLSI
jgi:hypothetical protein